MPPMRESKLEARLPGTPTPVSLRRSVSRVDRDEKRPKRSLLCEGWAEEDGLLLMVVSWVIFVVARTLLVRLASVREAT